MLLLKKTKDYSFKYQLPMDWEEQLAIVDDFLVHINSISGMWSFIKDNIMIYDLNDKEKAIWSKGSLQDTKYEKDMLKLSCEATKFFKEKFLVFIQEAGIIQNLSPSTKE